MSIPREITLRRGAAVGLASVPVIAGVLIGLFIWFLATFPFENTDERTTREKLELGILVGGWAVGFLSAVAMLYLIAVGRVLAGFVAYACHVSAAAVLIALGMDMSQHSDDIVFLFAAPIEVCALVSVLVASTELRATSRSQ